MLTGKRILVTGAAGGLGAGVIPVLREAGAQIVAADRATEALEGIPGLETLDLDLTDPASGAALRALGPLDGVAHLVGGFAMGSAVDLTPDVVWDRMIALNVNTLRIVLEAVVPPMREAGRGSIVTVGARNGVVGVGSMSAYSVAKSAVHRLTEALAEELLGTGVRVNAILPGVIDTPANRAAMPSAERGAWVSPSSVGEVIAFLLSDRSVAVHGGLIPVYGAGR